MSENNVGGVKVKFEADSVGLVEGLRAMRGSMENTKKVFDKFEGGLGKFAGGLSAITSAFGGAESQTAKYAQAVQGIAAGFSAGGPWGAGLAAGVAAIEVMTDKMKKAEERAQKLGQAFNAIVDPARKLRDAAIDRVRDEGRDLETTIFVAEASDERDAKIRERRKRLAFEMEDTGRRMQAIQKDTVELEQKALALKAQSSEEARKQLEETQNLVLAKKGELALTTQALNAQQQSFMTIEDVVDAQERAAKAAERRAKAEQEAAEALGRQADALIRRLRTEDDVAAVDRELSEPVDPNWYDSRGLGGAFDAKAHEQDVYDSVNAEADLHGAVLERQGDTEALAVATGDLAAAFEDFDQRRADEQAALNAAGDTAQSVALNSISSGRAGGALVSGATNGATIGMAAGPYGAVAGAVIGGFAGLISQTEAGEKAFADLEKTIGNFGNSIVDLLGDMGQSAMEWADSLGGWFDEWIETDAEKAATAAAADAANADIDARNAESEAAMSAYFDSLLEESGALKENTEALRDVTESMSNIPRGYRVALGMYQAETPLSSSGGSPDSGGSALPAAQFVNCNITFTGLDDELFKRAQAERKRRMYGTSTPPRGGGGGN